jgi:hypothetical protein
MLNKIGQAEAAALSEHARDRGVNEAQPFELWRALPDFSDYSGRTNMPLTLVACSARHIP